MIHPFLNRSTKSIDTLPRVTNCNKTSALGDEPFKHRMINGRKILRLVDEDKWILWEISSEQCGHIQLIVKVNAPGVRRLDALPEDIVDERLRELRWLFFKTVEENIGFNETWGSGADVIGDVPKR